MDCNKFCGLAIHSYTVYHSTVFPMDNLDQLETSIVLDNLDNLNQFFPWIILDLRIRKFIFLGVPRYLHGSIDTNHSIIDR